MGYALKNVNSIESMLRYCNDFLKWNIDEEYFDDIDELTYDFTASDLGIKNEEFAKINTLKQMRPLTDNQDWAVFLVDFEGKHIDVTALRRVLNAIIPKRTNRDRMTWPCDHIFFMCLWRIGYLCQACSCFLYLARHRGLRTSYQQFLDLRHVASFYVLEHVWRIYFHRFRRWKASEHRLLCSDFRIHCALY